VSVFAVQLELAPPVVVMAVLKLATAVACAVLPAAHATCRWNDGKNVAVVAVVEVVLVVATESVAVVLHCGLYEQSTVVSSVEVRGSGRGGRL
jgi:hypothetical protein